MSGAPVFDVRHVLRGPRPDVVVPRPLANPSGGAGDGGARPSWLRGRGLGTRCRNRHLLTAQNTYRKRHYSGCFYLQCNLCEAARWARRKHKLTNRLRATNTKIKTDYGSIYLHLHYDQAGKLVGGCLSHKWKDPRAQIETLIRRISEGLDESLRSGA